MSDPAPVGLPRVFVKPGKGVKVPLPIPGAGITIPKEGREVARTIPVERLIQSGDLVEAEAPDVKKSENVPAAAEQQPAADAAAKKG